MEGNNLNVAPTEQELKNEGFDFYFVGCYKQVTKFASICVSSDLSKCKLVIGHDGDEIDFTKQKINDAFALFNQPLPQWEKPKPKVGEVWKNDFYVFLIIKDAESNVLKLESETIEGVDWINYETADYGNFLFDKFTKVADSLEEYYKEKFSKVKSIKSVEKILVARKLWTDFGNISVDCNGDILEDFKPVGQNIVFEIGTDKKEVWHWFEETFNLSVAADLMYPKKKI